MISALVLAGALAHALPLVAWTMAGSCLTALSSPATLATGSLDLLCMDVLTDPTSMLSLPRNVRIVK